MAGAIRRGHDRRRRWFGPRERRLLQLPAGRDVRRRRHVDGREASPRRVPARHRGGSRSRAGGPRGARLPGGLRVGDRPRASQARAGRAARRPPDGRPVPVQGRRLRPAAVRRRGVLAVAAGHHRRCVRRGDAGLPSSSRPSEPERVDAVRSGVLDQPDGLAGPARRVPGDRAGRLGQPLDRRPPARRRGRSDRSASSKAGPPWRPWRS